MMQGLELGPAEHATALMTRTCRACPKLQPAPDTQAARGGNLILTVCDRLMVEGPQDFLTPWIRQARAGVLRGRLSDAHQYTALLVVW